MKKLSIAALAKACGGQLFATENPNNLYISNITTDSRKVSQGCLFIPLRGETFDGHDFINQTFSQGAVCCLSEKKLKTNKPYILVKSCYHAIKDIAQYYRSMFTIPFIGITGSVGKTSTKEMIASVLEQKFRVLKTQGNFNNELGVPLTLFGLEDYHEVAVIEMGISDFNEMTRLSTMVKPDICVITNIGDCHLEKLIDRKGVLRAKTEMFKNRNRNGKIFLNGDDDNLRTIADVDGTRPVFYGLNSDNDFYAKNIKNNGIDGVNCDLCFDNHSISVTIPAIGSYMVSNALVAVAIGIHLGLTSEEIKQGIESYKTVGSRAGVVDTGYITVIDDCYNANPVSVKGAIDTLMNLQGRKVCVLGDMKELGKNSIQLHNDVGQYAAQKKVDTLIAVGTESTAMAQGAKSGCSYVYHFNDIQTAIENLDNIVQKSDTVLVKASHSMKFENIVAYLKDLK
ncbi:MAG TPA: UDP-N-acetylmuramoyl-tripeptide--D-alanyl-D-alanine ligase [Clostridiales bacterium]|nr:UDP-N-acetylmuramoyl-tripeptide--D-alanyl-D-alanine ligase [Clostridiales bacterium]